MDNISRNEMSVEHLNDAIEEKDNEIKQLNAEVFMLNESLKRLSQEKVVVMNSLKKSKEHKDARQNDLKNKFNALESQLQTEDADFQKKYEEEKKKILKEKDGQIEQERKENEDAETELKRLNKEKDAMLKYEEEMETLKAIKAKNDEALKIIKYDFMLKSAKQNEKIKKVNEQKFQEELYRDKEDAEKQIKKLGVEIHEENAQMNEKSILQRYEIEKIKQQKEQIIKLNKSYKRDMMLYAETMEEYTNKNQNQNKKIKLLKSKIQILEKSLSQIVQDFEKEKTLLKKQNEETISAQSNALAELRSESKHKSRELKMLKSLSAVIIEQRSDIEQFFLEALEQIKEEIRKKVAEEKKFMRFRVPGDSVGGTVGSMGHTTGGASQDQTKSYADKVDLNDLDWEDRERVLRLLFSKINAGVHPSHHWKDIEGEGEGSQNFGELEEE